MRSFLPAFLLLVASPVAFGQTPRDPHELNPAGEANAPVVATDGELTVATWHDGFPNYRIHSSVSHDQGRTWSAPVIIDNASGAFKHLRESGTIVVDGEIYVSWFDNRLGASMDQYFTRSTDGGLNWTTDTTLDKGYPAGVGPVRDFRMAANDQYIFVLMNVELGPDSHELWGTRSSDGGVSWDQAHPVMSQFETQVVEGMDLILRGDMAHLTWVDSRYGLFVPYPDERNVWYHGFDLDVPGILQSSYLISNTSSGNHNAVAFQPSIDVQGAEAIVAFTVSTNGTGPPYEVRARVRHSLGLFGWYQEVVLGNYDTNAGDSATDPKVHIHGNGEISVVWEDDRNSHGTDEIFMTRSTDLGLTFQELASPLAQGTGARIDGSGDYLGVGYTGGTFPSNGARMVVSRDGGQNFGIPLDVPQGTGGSSFVSSLAFNETYSNYFLTWQGDFASNYGGWVGGLRTQTVTPIGPFAAGNTVNFRATRFGASEGGHEFMVVASPATGSTLIQGDGRDLFLANTGVLIHSYQNPLLKATLSANGDASTPLVTFPPSFAAGTTLHFVGLSRNAGGYYSITDVIDVVVQ